MNGLGWLSAVLMVVLFLQGSSGLAESALVDPLTERQGVSDDEILIGSCIPLTGTLRARGQRIISGANVYLSYINDQGGVNGRKIKLTSCDDAYDPEKAIECFNFCLKSRAFVGAFFAGSAQISKYVRMGELSKMPLMGFCTGTPAAYDFHPTEFVLRSSFVDEVKTAINDLWNIHHVRRIALIYQNDAYGAAIRQNVESELRKDNASLVAQASYTRKTTQVDEAFDTVKKSNPQVLILAASSDALTTIIKRKYQEKWDPIILAVSVVTDYLLDSPTESEGAVVTQAVPLLDRLSPTVALYKKLQKKYDPSVAPHLDAFEGFLNAMVLVEGLKLAGKDLTRTKFIKAMESLHDYDLNAGPKFKVTFSSTNHVGWTPASIYFVQIRSGKLVPMADADWPNLLKKHQ